MGNRKRKIKGKIFVISGPSGSGKTTLAERILKTRKIGKRLIKSVSFTTRPQRSGEKKGKDYFFISELGFRQANKAKKILEWTKYLGYYYGTPRDFIDKQLDQDKYVVMCLDLRGARRIKRLYPQNTVTIFIEPPSLEALRERILKRCHKTKSEEVNRRVALAKKELFAASDFDFRLVNDNLQEVSRQLSGIVMSKMAD